MRSRSGVAEKSPKRLENPSRHCGEIICQTTTTAGLGTMLRPAFVLRSLFQLELHVSVPPTVIVVHRRENRKKCSVEPLRSRSDFAFWTYPEEGPEPLDGYVRLGIGGPLLSEADRERGLLVLDATWRLAERMEKKYSHIPVRSLPTWQTAYPRVSKVFDDPAAGLATIEAIYLAYRQLGRDTTGLLDQYLWGQDFLERNNVIVQ